MEANKVMAELLKELEILEEKKEKILQDVEELTKQPEASPEEIKAMVGRIKGLIEDFESKLEDIGKISSKI